MLSDMIDDLVRADCPQEKEAAYRLSLIHI